MTTEPLDLPLKVAKAFIKDMNAYFAEENAIKRDEIAARQLHALARFQGPQEKKLRISDIKRMFTEISGNRSD
jgi:hypothetical protein